MISAPSAYLFSHSFIHSFTHRVSSSIAQTGSDCAMISGWPQTCCGPSVLDFFVPGLQACAHTHQYAFMSKGQYLPVKL